MLRCVSSRAGSVLDDDEPVGKWSQQQTSGRPSHKISAMAGPPPTHSRDGFTLSQNAVLHTSSALDAKKYELWRREANNRQLFDLLLCTDDGEQVHAASLDMAAASPFFLKLLTGPNPVRRGHAAVPIAKKKINKWGNIAEDVPVAASYEDARVVDIKGVRGAALRAAIQALYSQQVVNVGWCNVEELLHLAERLQMPTIRDVASSFLLQSVAEEPRAAWTLSSKYQCESVKAAVRVHIVHNFDSIVCSKDGAKLLRAFDLKNLAALFHDDSLSIHSEMLIVKAVEAMAALDKEAREHQDYSHLLLAMRVEHLGAGGLNEALASPAVQACPKVVARFANVALHLSARIELDFPPRPKRESSWFTWRLPDAAKLGTAKARSMEFPIPGSQESWCLVAAANGSHPDADLGLFLSVGSHPSSDTWQERIGFRIRLINTNQPTRSVEHGFDEGEVLDASRKVWGFKKHAKMADIRDRSAGFLWADGSVAIQVQGRALPMEHGRSNAAAKAVAAAAAKQAAELQELTRRLEAAQAAAVYGGCDDYGVPGGDSDSDSGYSYERR